MTKVDEMTEHLKIMHWCNGWILVESEDHKWDEIMLTVQEQRELLNYLLINIEEHEQEEKKEKEDHEKKYGKSERGGD